MAIMIGGVMFVESEDKGFTWEAYRWDSTEPIAWIAETPEGVEVHTAVSIEKYKTLDDAARAIEQYK
ncbi:hypothetical protein [Ruminococcus sp.]|uniref:hypothetical protein n=1 Tax=Ruminococcus sp. TaxID=41978 RepID=UPI0025EADC41|nr:hypothetical protein [Ruminococcus sp.]MBQ8966757.1 hypothetical protein [Ruminococcus sp.]